MRIIRYTQKYEDQVVQLWNETLLADPITKAKFRRQALFDENFNEDLCFAAVEGDIVVGFLLAMKRKFPYLERGLEPTRGWISVMFVKASEQRKGIGTKLLLQAEDALKNLGVCEITLAAYSPNYFFAGVDKDAYASAVSFFQKLGYSEKEESYSMCKDLHGFQMSESAQRAYQQALQAGYQFVSFTYEYALDLLAFAKAEFGGGWKRNLLLSMQADQAEDCVMIVLDANHRIVGFCMRMIDGNPMRFGPIGVKESARNDGIGGILFEKMQFEMFKRGLYHLFFISTDAPGRRFYERHDVHVYRTYVGFRKVIQEAKS